ncbi:Kelch repeat-containing protein [Chengkuizengella axinellae]|uniref:Kelch repeat-containing protein n=1 Tax=Chengkuizengella axinellae TaxID=3064388 RepID=A0ABT9IXU7_9BACL|nr:kelch repeat-containing protein [Chengkuizengella sp. 2205SS18-9]MDP5273629.1 kelch repeat-containing protein [Chengkuizengella sp. 2205SS18-9]
MGRSDYFIKKRNLILLVFVIFVFLFFSTSSFANDTDIQNNMMIEGRWKFETEVLGGEIYVIGGENKDGSLNLVEKFNPILNQWEQVANMNSARILHTTSVLNGEIYVLGGYSKQSTYKSMNQVEVYNPDTDTWTVITEKSSVVHSEVADGEIICFYEQSECY